MLAQRDGKEQRQSLRRTVAIEVFVRRAGDSLAQLVDYSESGGTERKILSVSSAILQKHQTLVGDGRRLTRR